MTDVATPVDATEALMEANAGIGLHMAYEWWAEVVTLLAAAGWSLHRTDAAPDVERLRDLELAVEFLRVGQSRDLVQGDPFEAIPRIEVAEALQRSWDNFDRALLAPATQERGE